MKHFVALPYLLSMYLTSSGRGFLPLVSWDQAVTSVYIVLTAACSIQGKEEECIIHIRVLKTLKLIVHTGAQIAPENLSQIFHMSTMRWEKDWNIRNIALITIGLCTWKSTACSSIGIEEWIDLKRDLEELKELGKLLFTLLSRLLVIKGHLFLWLSQCLKTFKATFYS